MKQASERTKINEMSWDDLILKAIELAYVLETCALKTAMTGDEVNAHLATLAHHNQTLIQLTHCIFNSWYSD